MKNPLEELQDLTRELDEFNTMKICVEKAIQNHQRAVNISTPNAKQLLPYMEQHIEELTNKIKQFKVTA